MDLDLLELLQKNVTQPRRQKGQWGKEGMRKKFQNTLWESFFRLPYEVQSCRKSKINGGL